MKKLILILFVSFLSFSSFSQNYYTSKFWNLLTADTIKVNEWLMYKGDTIWFPTYTNGRDLAIKNVADPVDLTDVVNLQTLLANISGFDSIDYNILDNGLLRFLSTEVVTFSVSLDGRHVEFSDSTIVFVTPTQLTDSLGNYVTNPALNDSLSEYVKYSDSTDVYYTQHSLDSLLAIAGTQNSFEIELPINGTLAGSVAAATEFPDGWVLGSTGNNLEINHGLGRYGMVVTVAENTTGEGYRNYRPYDDSYTGLLNVDTNNLTVEGLTADYRYVKLKIWIIFL